MESLQKEILIEPPLYFANEHVFDATFSPKNEILTCCLINGEVKMYYFYKLKRLKYSEEDVVEIKSFNYHTKSCRKVDFSLDGNYICSGSKDKSLGFLDADYKLIYQINEAHPNPISSIKFLNNQVLASGDDEGVIKIWDLRSGKEIYSVTEQEEAITDFDISLDMNYLLSTSYDGTLGVYDLRKPNESKEKLHALSDCLETDLLSILLMRCKIDEDIFLTGCEDGFLRGCSIHPNKILSVLGEHSEDETKFPIAKITLSHCKNFVASTSHDESIKFYEISGFLKKAKSLKDKKVNDNEVNMDLEKEDEEFEDVEEEVENKIEKNKIFFSGL